MDVMWVLSWAFPRLWHCIRSAAVMKARQWIVELFPALTENQFQASLQEIGLNRVDLDKLRSHLENRTRTLIPDSLWMKLPSLAALENYIEGITKRHSHTSHTGGLRAERYCTLNMPQMAAGGMSEQCSISRSPRKAASGHDLESDFS